MSGIYPLLIEPRYVERIWGGDALATRLGKAAPTDRPIGESWEIYEENAVLNGAYAGKTIGDLRTLLGRDLMGHVDPSELFPLLTKLIDARDVLSVQVHPDNAAARRLEHQPYGKTECWYVVHAEPGATLTYGFREDATPEEYTQRVHQGTLDQILRPLPVTAGDVIYIPAGTVHAIGAGIIVYELQQTSDVTYRIYDWNRTDAAGTPRELHVDKARQVLDYHHATRGTVRPLRLGETGRTLIIAGPYFAQELVEANATQTYKTHNSPVIVCALDQPLGVQVATSPDEVHVQPYSSVLIPAAAGAYNLVPDAGSAEARALVAYIPPTSAALRDEIVSFGITDAEIDRFLEQFAPATGLGQAATGSAAG